MRSVAYGIIVFLCIATHAEARRSTNSSAIGTWYYTVLCQTMQDADRYEALYNNGMEPEAIGPLMRRVHRTPACTSTRFVVTHRLAPWYLFRMRHQLVYAFEATVRREEDGARPDPATRLSISNRVRLLKPEKAVVLWATPE
jgi:hypothetical protein